MTYHAEKWTDIYGAKGHHELWAVISEEGEAVAFGSKAFAEKTSTDFSDRFAHLAGAGNKRG